MMLPGRVQIVRKLEVSIGNLGTIGNAGKFGSVRNIVSNLQRRFRLLASGCTSANPSTAKAASLAGVSSLAGSSMAETQSTSGHFPSPDTQ